LGFKPGMGRDAILFLMSGVRVACFERSKPLPARAFFIEERSLPCGNRFLVK
jgi:hypothetical protein